MSESKIEMTTAKISLMWPMENDLPNIFANYIAFTESETEVVLVFGSFLPTGFHKRPKEEVEEFLNKTKIQPVAKIVMTKAGFESMFNMLEMQRKRSKEDDEPEK